jgi:hypothetical protein
VLHLMPMTRETTAIAPGTFVFSSDVLRLPVLPKADNVRLELAPDGRFILTDLGTNRVISGRCLDAPNGYRMVGNDGKPVGLTLQVVGANPTNRSVALNGLLLRRAES